MRQTANTITLAQCDVSKRHAGTGQPHTLTVFTAEFILEVVQDLLEGLQDRLVALLLDIAWQVLLVFIRQVPGNGM